jgi:hypothetical protein
LFDPTDGVEVSSLGSFSDGVVGVVIEGVPPIAGGMFGSAMGGVDSLMEISSTAPSLSTWKLNNPKAISKPLVLAEVDPVKLEMGSTVVVIRESMANTGVVGDAGSMLVDAVASTMVGDAVSMLMLMANEAMPMADEAMSVSMADEAMSVSMAVGGAESTTIVGDEPSILVDANRLAMVGEGAGESIDPGPVVLTVGAN